MPEVHVYHGTHVGLGGDQMVFSYEEASDFMQLLRKQCAELFSVDEWPLKPDDFSIYDQCLAGMSSQTHDVIIRITLHNFPARVQNGDDNAKKLAAAVAEHLNTKRWLDWRGRVTIGVSLTFAEIAWGTA